MTRLHQDTTCRKQLHLNLHNVRTLMYAGNPCRPCVRPRRGRIRDFQELTLQNRKTKKSCSDPLSHSYPRGLLPAAYVTVDCIQRVLLGICLLAPY